MTGLDTTSWIVSITPEHTVRARPQRRSALLRKLSRLLASAGLAYAMTDPQIVAMLATDEGVRSQDGR